MPSLLLLLALAAPAGAGEQADPSAVRRLLKDPSPSARAAAIRRLAAPESPAVLPVVYDTLADPHPYVRRAAAGVLGTVLTPEIRRRIADQVPRLRLPLARSEACRAFALWADEDGWLGLRRAAGDPDALVRAEAIRWLAEDPAVATADLLTRALGDPDPRVRAEAIEAAASRADAGPIAVMLADADPGVRMAALDALTAGVGEAAVAAVLRGLADPVWSVRILAAERASRLRDRRILLPLARALGDERRRVTEAAHTALVSIVGIPFDPDPARWTAWLEGEGRAFDPALVAPPERAATASGGAGHTVESVRFLDLPIVSKHVGCVSLLPCQVVSLATACPRVPGSSPDSWAAATEVADGPRAWSGGDRGAPGSFSEDGPQLGDRAIPGARAEPQAALRATRRVTPAGIAEAAGALPDERTSPRLDAALLVRCLVATAS